MDDGRFDSLVKALAEGKSRRSVLKGLLGLGGAAIVGTAVVESDTDAAVRRTPTPTPVKCPGQQTNVGGVCTCPPTAPQKCGPACCTKGNTPAGNPGYSECCDNACCNGTCLSEEGCCPTNNRAGGLPPTHRICNGPNGPKCCLWEQDCCLIDGCCDTVCYGGMVDNSYCCSEADFCPGGNESEGQCCTNGTVCCGGGTNANACIDPETQCCTDFDCGEGDPCKVCDPETHTCRPRCDEATEVCCTEQAGPGICQKGDCCPGAPCPGGGCQECGVDPGTGIAQCTDKCYPKTCCTIGEPNQWYCPAGECCPNNQGCEDGDVCCGTGADAVCEQGPYCGCDSDQDCAACEVCDRGTCVAGCEADEICCDEECLSAEDFFTCGDTCCAVEDTCCEGECCTGECLRYSQAPDVCCTTLACLEGEDRECCPNVDDYKCCGDAGCCAGQCTGKGGNECCTTGLQCPLADGSSECCPNSADYKCCGTAGCCTSSQCNEDANVCCSEASFACGTTAANLCCGSETEKCCDGVCIDASECCESTDGPCCIPFTCADAPQYSCPAEFDDGCGGTIDCSDICPAGQSCNASGWCCGDPGQVCATESECCSLYCCGGFCSDTPCDPCLGIQCVECRICDLGACVPGPDGAQCTGGFCSGGDCICLGNSSINNPVQCDASYECCSGCCFDSSTAVSDICSQIANTALRAICNGLLPQLLNDDICLENPLQVGNLPLLNIPCL